MPQPTSATLGTFPWPCNPMKKGAHSNTASPTPSSIARPLYLDSCPSLFLIHPLCSNSTMSMSDSESWDEFGDEEEVPLSQSTGRKAKHSSEYRIKGALKVPHLVSYTAQSLFGVPHPSFFYAVSRTDNLFVLRTDAFRRHRPQRRVPTRFVLHPRRDSVVLTYFLCRCGVARLETNGYVTVLVRLSPEF